MLALTQPVYSGYFTTGVPNPGAVARYCRCAGGLAAGPQVIVDQQITNWKRLAYCGLAGNPFLY